MLSCELYLTGQALETSQRTRTVVEMLSSNASVSFQYIVLASYGQLKSMMFSFVGFSHGKTVGSLPDRVTAISRHSLYFARTDFGMTVVSSPSCKNTSGVLESPCVVSDRGCTGFSSNYGISELRNNSHLPVERIVVSRHLWKFESLT